MGDHADAYLRRFIDLSYQLPKPQLQAFVQLLLEKSQLTPLFQTRKDGNLEYQRIVPTFIDTAQWLNLDLRTQEQCFTRFNAIARLWSQNTYIPTDALCILVGLKVGRAELFDELHAGRASYNDLAPKTSDVSKGFPSLVAATLETVFLSKDAFTARCEAVRVLRQKPSEYDEVSYNFAYVASYRNELLRLIDFSTRFE